MPTCATCRYFYAPEACRRHAPVMVPLYGRTVSAATTAAGWCGDYAPTPPGRDARDYGEQ